MEGFIFQERNYKPYNIPQCLKRKKNYQKLSLAGKMRSEFIFQLDHKFCQLVQVSISFCCRKQPH